MIGLAEALLVVAVWIGASAAVLAGLRNVVAGGAALAALAAGAILAIHGAWPAGALLGAGGAVLAFWLRPAAPERPSLLPPGSAPVLTLCVVIGALSVWVGGAVVAGPGGAPGRTAALILVGLGASRLIAQGEAARLAVPALLLALGLGAIAAFEPVQVAIHPPVAGAAVAAVVAAFLTFGGVPRQWGGPAVWAAALAGLGVAVLDPGLALLALAPVLLLFAQARAQGVSHGARSAALAAALLGVAALAAAPAGGDKIERLAALAAALGAAAAAGLLPHLMELDGSEAARAVFLRRALLAPALVLAVTLKLEPALAPTAAHVFGATLLGVGALNVVAGLVTGLAGDRLQAWRAAYVAEWGLVLAGLGLQNPAGAAAAYLLLLTILLLRLPPGAWLATDETVPRSGRARGVLLALAFAGAAPFAGFAGRLLLLRGATTVAWPLALAIGLALAAWLPASWRLGAGVRRPRGRLLDATQLAGLVATAAIGIFPAAVLRPVGLG